MALSLDFNMVLRTKHLLDRDAHRTNEPPTLFGEPGDQDVLLRLFAEGQAHKPSRLYISQPLRRSGLIALAQSGRSTFLLLAPQHPAYELIHRILEKLCGMTGQPPVLSPPPGCEYTIDTARPLGHRSELYFRVLLHVARFGSRGGNVKASDAGSESDYAARRCAANATRWNLALHRSRTFLYRPGTCRLYRARPRARMHSCCAR